MSAAPGPDLPVVDRVPEGEVHELVLGEAPGPVLTLWTLGATVGGLHVTGGDGVRRDVALTHARPADALTSTEFFGGTIGRVANRVAAGRFELDGRRVGLAANEGRTTLHGGPVGFDKRLWRVLEHGPGRALLGLTSADGDQGFPGTVEARLAVTVGETVDLELTATTDAPTPVALTSHLYLRLAGSDSERGVLDHELQVAANRVHPTDEEQVPLAGDGLLLDGSAYDLRTARVLAEVVEATGGVDHDYVLTGTGMRDVAWLSSPLTRTRAVLSTDQPDLQVYTGGALTTYDAFAGLALEPQTTPDAVNRPEADAVVLRPGATYRNRISWRFGAL